MLNQSRGNAVYSVMCLILIRSMMTIRVWKQVVAKNENSLTTHNFFHANNFYSCFRLGRSGVCSHAVVRRTLKPSLVNSLGV